MSDLRSTIISRIATSKAPGTVLPRLVSEHSHRHGFYSALISVLCDLDLSDEQAKGLWNRAETHRSELQAMISRNVDVRLSLMDLLIADVSLGTNPKISDVVRDEQRRRDAFHDEVTGLHNRRYVMSCIARELSRSTRYGLSFALVFVDLDNFKEINDSFGHATGDEVLRAFAGHLRSMLRAEDVAARYGGDEFIVLMPRTDSEGAEHFARRLLDSAGELARHITAGVGFSAGVASYPADGSATEEIIGAADRRLYAVKAAGGGSVELEGDKRRYDRYPAGFPVEVDLGEGNPLHASTRDLSAGGMSIETEERIEVGRTLQLRIHSSRERKTYSVSSKIVWMREIPERSRYRIGTMYRHRDEETVQKLVESARHNAAG